MPTTPAAGVLSRPLVVGLADDDRSDGAIARGLELAHRFGQPIDFVHGLPVSRLRRTRGDADRQEALHGRWTSAALGALTERVREAAGGRPVPEDAVFVLPGRADDVLVERARERGAGLILMGSHKRRGLIDLGRTARSVLTHAPCAVWSQVGTPRRIRRVLVPIDLLGPVDELLDAAIEVAAALDASVTVLHVYVPPEFAYGAGPDPGPVGYVVEGLEREAEDELEQIVEARRGGEVPVESRFAEGDPVGTILDMQDACDLVVMSTHARNVVSAAVLGSVTWGVLREADVPVLAVRRQEEDA